MLSRFVAISACNTRSYGCIVQLFENPNLQQTLVVKTKGSLLMRMLLLQQRGENTNEHVQVLSSNLTCTICCTNSRRNLEQIVCVPKVAVNLLSIEYSKTC